MTVLLAATLALIETGSAPAYAQAVSLTRGVIVMRAKSWVKKRVRYDQSSCREGYRRDCSGMVSMAWSLDKSYTTRTLAAKAVRIPVHSLSPGDAVLTDRHVTLFESWKDRRTHTYVALELYQTGKPARRVVKRVPGGAVALRRRGLAPARRRVPVRPPAPAAVSSGVPTVTPPTS